MDTLLLSHAWLAGLAMLAPLYTCSRWLQRRPVSPSSLPRLAAARRVDPNPTRQPASTRVRAAAGQPDAQTLSAAPALRVLSVVDAGAQQPGRLRISGRMADVCAELDRMVEREARQARRNRD